ncbi:MAG: hypothetical protein NC336_07065, partial [Clostridium sp.]|nr:hypothetical protein [Clostridium sp.]
PIFLQIVSRGCVTVDELRSMNRAFRMKYLDADNHESASLLEMLLQKDNPLKEDSPDHRFRTIGHVLRHISRTRCQLKAREFSRHMYDNYDGTDNLTMWGWYEYYLDNNWQYRFTQIFHEILSFLKNNKQPWVAVEDLSTEMAVHVVENFAADMATTLREVISSLEPDKKQYPVAESLRNLLIYCRDNRYRIDTSEIQYERMGIRSENFCSFIRSVESDADTKFFDFTKKLIEDIIYRHYRVSFRKMLQTRKATQKFAFENGHLKFIDNWDATDTSPRIDTMRNFLIDLNIIAPKDGIDTLTDSGVKLMKKLNDGDTVS